MPILYLTNCSDKEISETFSYDTKRGVFDQLKEWNGLPARQNIGVEIQSNGGRRAMKIPNMKNTYVQLDHIACALVNHIAKGIHSRVPTYINGDKTDLRWSNLVFTPHYNDVKLK